MRRGTRGQIGMGEPRSFRKLNHTGMGELFGKASACLREAPPPKTLCGGQALRRRQGRTFSTRSTYIPEPRWSSLSVASSDCLNMSTRPPSEALKSGLPMAVFANTGGKVGIHESLTRGGKRRRQDVGFNFKWKIDTGCG